MQSNRSAGRRVRPAGLVLLACAAIGLTGVPASAASPVVETIGASASGAVNQFYLQRASRPLWFAPGNRDAAVRLLGLMQSSELDGIKSKKLDPGKVKKALRLSESSDPQDLREADRLVSEAFIRYVAAVRANASPNWEIVDAQLSPKLFNPAALLAQAAAAPSLVDYIDRMQFLHESYAGLREALAAADDRGDRATDALLRLNMRRAALIPSTGRFVLVNAAAQRLYMYDNGRVVDSMKVVVGKPDQPTPMMAALIRYAAVNPYWNLPPDLVAERVAPNVMKDGLGYLKAKGYVILSDYGEKAKVVDPSKVNWQAVSEGKIQLRMRQNPGATNAMGRMKFMFPNTHGVYLHDTPNKELLGEDARLFSAGCVRLEDAPRLARWLYGKPLSTKGRKPEEKVELGQPVPVYLAYLTAVPDNNGQVAFLTDIYGRDQRQLGGKELAAR